MCDVGDLLSLGINMFKHLNRILAGGLAGGVAWYLGMMVFFGPAQRILTSSTLQSAKFNAVFQTLEPLPRTTGQPFIMIAGLLVISTVYAWVHSSIRTALPGSIIRRTLKFGLLLWAVMVPWFEFYLPWNVMHEPALLVFLECACWFGVMQLVAFAIVITDTLFTSKLAPDDHNR
jgi:hypothetical protein